MLQSPFTYTRKTTTSSSSSSSKKRSFTCFDNDYDYDCDCDNNNSITTINNYELPTPSTPSVSHKRQRTQLLLLLLMMMMMSTHTPINSSSLLDKLTSMESKVNNLQDNELKFELQDLLQDSVQLLRDIKLPQKSFDEFYSPMSVSSSSSSSSLSSCSSTDSTNSSNTDTTIDNIYETPKEKIRSYDKFTTPPRIPKLGYYFQTMFDDEIESTGLDF